MGIEPTRSAWKAEVLPLNYIRIYVSRCLQRLVLYHTHPSLSIPFFPFFDFLTPNAKIKRVCFEHIMI